MSITLKNRFDLSYDEEADLLISALHAWGIDYLIANTQNAAIRRAEVISWEQPLHDWLVG